MGRLDQDSDTKLMADQVGQGAGSFKTTHWSVVLMAGQQHSPEAAAALEQLCRAYWYPLYAYARRQGHSPSDGEDLTQQFFAVFLAKNSFLQASPERGRFRNFLLASFKHFVANEYHRSQTVKRGGRFAFISWDDADPEGQYLSGLVDGLAPESLFDRAWAFTLLAKAMKSLQADYVASGKGQLFEALQVFLTGEKPGVTYEAVGVTLQMGEGAVKMAVSRLRQRYGQMLRREVAHTLTDPAWVEDELRHLVGVLSR